MFQRCLRQTLVRSPRCKNAPSSSANLLTSHLTRGKAGSFTQLSSTRCFSISTRKLEQAATESQPAPDVSTRPPQLTAQRSTPPRASPPTTTPARKHRVDILGIASRSATPGTYRPPLEDQLDTFSIVPPKNPNAVNNFYNILKTKSPARPDQDSLLAKIDQEPTNDLPPLPALRLKPTLGRTVSLSGSRGVDLTRAFRLLEMRCSQNSVRSDAREQKTYVRRGQRRKNDRIRRWRALFQAGFMAECARVRRMRAQGW